MMRGMHRDEITVDVAARLVAGQFPQWADLAVTPVALNGWDNTTFRLGEGLLVRLPSGDGYAAAVEKEQRWLPMLAGRLTLPIPAPVALGRPGSGYPWPWSIYRWIDGEPASVGRIADLTHFAADLAGFLTGLQSIDATDGPPPGQHSAHRGGPLAYFDDEEIPEAIQSSCWPGRLTATPWPRCGRRPCPARGSTRESGCTGMLWARTCLLPMGL